MNYLVRLTAPDHDAETFEELEDAHARFAELTKDHPDARISLIGPNGLLLRRRPANSDRCHFCPQPAPATWPVTGFGSDNNTRLHDVVSLCPEHHTALSDSAGLTVNGWRWAVGHSAG